MSGKEKTMRNIVSYFNYFYNEQHEALNYIRQGLDYVYSDKTKHGCRLCGHRMKGNPDET